MRLAVITLILSLSLVAFAASHVVLVIRIVRRTPVGWLGLLAIGVPPLAPYWGVLHDLRAPTVVWLAALAAWVTGVSLG